MCYNYNPQNAKIIDELIDQLQKDGDEIEQNFIENNKDHLLDRKTSGIGKLMLFEEGIIKDP